MQIEAKPRTVAAVIVAIVIITVGYIYLKITSQQRKYKKETKILRMVEEHQGLEIQVMKQKAELDAMKKAIEDAMPVYSLTPVEQDKKDKALEEMNKEQE